MIIEYIYTQWSHHIGDDFIEGDDQNAFWGLLDQSPDVNTFLETWRQQRPRDYWLNHRNLVNAAESHFRRRTPSPEPLAFTEFDVPDQLNDWVQGNLVQPAPYRPKSLILIGDSRTGKTMWARSLGSHSYIANDWNLDSLVAGSRYVIFDDIPWERFKYSFKSWLGCQRNFTVTDKYRHKRTITGGIPSIYIGNKENDPFTFCSHLEEQWIKENCVVFYVNNKLY